MGSSVQLSSVLGPGLLRPWSPAGPGSEQTPGGKQPSPWPGSPLVPSLSRHTLPAYTGGPGAQECQAMQVTLVLLRCLRPHLCLSSLFSS